MSVNTKILEIKRNFAEKFADLNLEISKSEMLDPVNELRCERVAINGDFGLSPFFSNDMLAPYENNEFAQDSIFIYCHDDQTVLDVVKKIRGDKIPEEMESIENDIRNALAFLDSPRKNSDDEAAAHCENLAAPVKDLTESQLGAAFNIILKSMLDKSVKANSTCLDKTWFTSEHGLIPGSDSLGRLVSSYRSWNKLRAASRKDELVKNLSCALNDFQFYMKKYQETKGGLKHFLEKSRHDFKESHGTSQAKGFCFIKWQENDKSEFSLHDSDDSTHIMILHNCADNEIPEKLLESDAKRMTEWFNGETYSFTISDKSGAHSKTKNGFFKSDIEDESIVRDIETMAKQINDDVDYDRQKL